MPAHSSCEVLFNIRKDCMPLPERKFRKIIQDNYFTKHKFYGQLNSEQVTKMYILFETASKGQAISQGACNRRPTLRREIPFLNIHREGLAHASTCNTLRNDIPVVRMRQPLGSSSFADERNLDYYPRHDYYRDRRDPLSHRDRYQGRQEPHEERPYVYGGQHSTYMERQDRYIDRCDPYKYRDYLYREETGSYLGYCYPGRVRLDHFYDSYTNNNCHAHVDCHTDNPRPDPHKWGYLDPHRWVYLPDQHNVYKEDRGTVQRSSYCQDNK